MQLTGKLTLMSSATSDIIVALSCAVVLGFIAVVFCSVDDIVVVVSGAVVVGGMKTESSVPTRS